VGSSNSMEQRKMNNGKRTRANLMLLRKNKSATLKTTGEVGIPCMMLGGGGTGKNKIPNTYWWRDLTYSKKRQKGERRKPIPKNEKKQNKKQNTYKKKK